MTFQQVIMSGLPFKRKEEANYIEPVYLSIYDTLEAFTLEDIMAKDWEIQRPQTKEKEDEQGTE